MHKNTLKGYKFPIYFARKFESRDKKTYNRESEGGRSDGFT